MADYRYPPVLVIDTVTEAPLRNKAVTFHDRDGLAAQAYDADGLGVPLTTNGHGVVRGWWANIPAGELRSDGVSIGVWSPDGFPTNETVDASVQAYLTENPPSALDATGADPDEVPTADGAGGWSWAPPPAGGGTETEWRVVTDADTTGTTSATTPIQAHIDAAAAAGGGVVYLRPGTYKLSGHLIPKSNVTIVGAGTHSTILKPQGTASAFKGTTFTEAAPLTDFIARDFTIDGTGQTLDNGSYNVQTKGFFIQYLRRCRFENLYIHDTAATGLGIDFFDDVVIDKVTANGCGRLNPGTEPGGAGIGIGTGFFDVENFTITNCTAKNNGRAGIFVERQNGAGLVTGGRVVSCYAEGNKVGFEDSGMLGFQWVGCIAYANVGAGMSISSGTLASSHPGEDGSVVGGFFHANGTHGLLWDASTQPSQMKSYLMQGVTVKGNGVDGIRIIAGPSNPSQAITVASCVSRDNDECGIRVTTAGAGFNFLLIHGCQVFNNGKDTGATVRDGIHIAAAVWRGKIADNQCFDTLSGAAKTQQYGLSTAAGFTVSHVGIHDNALADNAVAAGVNLAGTVGTGTYLRGNSAYNPRGALSVSPTGSPWTYTAGFTPETLYLLNATISNISKGGQTIYNAGGTAASVQLEPGQQVTVTYTGSLAAKTDRF